MRLVRAVAIDVVRAAGSALSDDEQRLPAHWSAA